MSVWTKWNLVVFSFLVGLVIFVTDYYIGHVLEKELDYPSVVFYSVIFSLLLKTVYYDVSNSLVGRFAKYVKSNDVDYITVFRLLYSVAILCFLCVLVDAERFFPIYTMSKCNFLLGIIVLLYFFELTKSLDVKVVKDAIWSGGRLYYEYETIPYSRFISPNKEVVEKELCLDGLSVEWEENGKKRKVIFSIVILLDIFKMSRLKREYSDYEDFLSIVRSQGTRFVYQELEKKPSNTSLLEFIMEIPFDGLKYTSDSVSLLWKDRSFQVSEG